MPTRPDPLDTLIDMHSYARPAGSQTETAFIRKYLAPLPGAERDPFGNWQVHIGDASILFSSHTDTVARRDGRQRVYLNRRGILSLDRSERTRRNCLGADDTAGIWIMRELIQAGVPGHYVFHYAEEIGGVGSYDLADDAPAWLTEIQIAIAFDRRGRTDVITSQAGGMCASDVFAESLAEAIRTVDPRLVYAPAAGVFTDTANYTEIIPECTNLSVGYQREHSPEETLDTRHLCRLRDAMIDLDYPSLTVSRDPRPVSRYDWDDNDTSGYRDPYFTANGYRDPFDSATDDAFWRRVFARYL